MKYEGNIIITLRYIDVPWVGAEHLACLDKVLLVCLDQVQVVCLDNVHSTSHY